MTRILLVEDEMDLGDIIADNLEDEGYEVHRANDGREGLAQWRSCQPDLVVLDVMLPHMDGLSLCKLLRQEGDRTPVLFLSAKGQPEDRVKGLSVGGDDYLVKPFHLPEFLMRVHTMLRRQHWNQDDEENPLQTQFGGHTIDLERGQAQLNDGRQIELSRDERKLLALFVSRPGDILNREFLLDSLWSDGVYPSTRAIERLVQQLRNWFEPQPHSPIYFHRLSGVRFQFTPDATSDTQDAT